MERRKGKEERWGKKEEKKDDLGNIKSIQSSQQRKGDFWLRRAVFEPCLCYVLVMLLCPITSSLLMSVYPSERMSELSHVIFILNYR